MKTLYLATALIATCSAMGQKSKIDPKIAQLIDPGISVHNYKHPQKAALAKKLQFDKGIELQLLSARPFSYKAPAKLTSQLEIPPFNLSPKEMKRLNKSHHLTEIITKPKENEEDNEDN
jgi:hypothetical protein